MEGFALNGHEKNDVVDAIRKAHRSEDSHERLPSSGHLDELHKRIARESSTELGEEIRDGISFPSRALRGLLPCEEGKKRPLSKDASAAEHG